MKTRRREIEGVSLSFLDVISCGFGALILLLVLTRVFEPVILEDSVENLQGYLAKLQEELFDLRGDTKDLRRELLRQEDMEVEKQKRVARYNIEMSSLEAEYEKTQDKTRINNLIEGRLAQAKQSLTDEMKVLLADYQRTQDENKIGGVPVDSEYVIFIIDTSGSMLEYAWPLVRQKVSETLAIYPRLKGIQVMSDDGHYMFPQYAGDWISDTQARRNAINDRLRDWQAPSPSSPVGGITKAISTYYRSGHKISLYVFGDDFQGGSIQRVITNVDRINKVDPATGKRRVRIHAIGFPVHFSVAGGSWRTAFKFSMLMRILCARNGGTFVGLNDHRVTY